MNEFDMPKDLSDKLGTHVPGTYREPVSKYAPKAKMLDALERELSAPSPPPARIDWSADDAPIAEIKNLIKKLTHRQMQTLCNALYKDAKEIDRVAMPDVMDRFAYGE